MSINFRPLNQHDQNYGKVIDLYKSAFTTVRHVPAWILRFKLRKGQPGFNIIYDADSWLGLISTTDYKDIIFVHFFAISESVRSGGYGSKVLDFIKATQPEKRIVLNVEILDEREKNYPQRVKRRAFYEKNGFVSSGFIIQDSREQLDMLILGGSITKVEIEELYRDLFDGIWGFLLRPKIISTGIILNE